jgi:hypothetical protein
MTAIDIGTLLKESGRVGHDRQPPSASKSTTSWWAVTVARRVVAITANEHHGN